MNFPRYLALGLLWLPLIAQADLRLVAREYLNNRPTVTTTHWFSADKSARDDGRTRTVMRFDLGRMYVIDRQARSYRSLDLPDAPALKTIVLPTQDTRLIGNWLARRWRVDGPAAHGLSINLWATTDIERGDAFVDLMQKLARQPGAEWLAAYARIDGFPVLQEISLTEKGMTQTRRSEVASCVVMEPPADTYLPPRGYKRIP
ncbi:MAG: hypothetical protein ACRES4_04935 [Nevskiales bacterium]